MLERLERCFLILMQVLYRRHQHFSGWYFQGITKRPSLHWNLLLLVLRNVVTKYFLSLKKNVPMPQSSKDMESLSVALLLRWIHSGSKRNDRLANSFRHSPPWYDPLMVRKSWKKESRGWYMSLGRVYLTDILIPIWKVHSKNSTIKSGIKPEILDI